jgi:hypothetical protein
VVPLPGAPVRRTPHFVVDRSVLPAPDAPPAHAVLAWLTLQAVAVGCVALLSLAYSLRATLRTCLIFLCRPCFERSKCCTATFLPTPYAAKARDGAATALPGSPAALATAPADGGAGAAANDDEDSVFFRPSPGPSPLSASFASSVQLMYARGSCLQMVAIFAAVTRRFVLVRIADLLAAVCPCCCSAYSLRLRSLAVKQAV